MKNIVKKIPVLGSLIIKLYSFFRSDKQISKKYWEERYKQGGNSGPGSYNHLAEFKAEVINDFIQENAVKSVIELGCGDGNQLKYLHSEHYLGIDVSPTVVKRCRRAFQDDSGKEFKLLKNFKNDQAELSLSLDVVYHLLEEHNFEEHLSLLFSSATRYVIIFSSNTNENPQASFHVKNRKFTDWIEENIDEFSFISKIPNKFPYDGNSDLTSHADFYIYQRK